SAALALTIVLAVAVLGSRPLQAQTYSILYSFTGTNGDGANPVAGLLRDAAGNLFGTAEYGGDYAAGCCGVVFALDTKRKETVLHRFGGAGDGAFPTAGLIQGEAGNFFGTTSEGGDLSCPITDFGCGTVFALTNGRLTVLHAFTGPDGAIPFAGLLRDSSGNLFGTTQ